MEDLGFMRNEYDHQRIDDKNIEKNPLSLFNTWFKEALNKEDTEVNAMILSTSGKNNRPSSRVVLLKEYSNDGFIFYTNYLSRKGEHINENPYVSLLFYWAKSARQIRIEGYSKKISPQKSDLYFSQRPRENMASAIISKQSQKLEISMDSLIESHKKLVTSITVLKRPQDWGGYIIIPEYFEFWQGNRGRFHDRFQYSKQVDNKNWIVDRLYP